MVEGGLVGAVGIAAEYRIDNFLVLPVGMLKVGFQEWDAIEKITDPCAGIRHSGDEAWRSGDFRDGHMEPRIFRPV